MILFPLSLVIAGVAIFVSLFHLNQGIANYFDFVAFAMVFGGTLAVAVATLPWEYRKDIQLGFKMLFRAESSRYKTTLAMCLEYLASEGKSFSVSSDEQKSLAVKILRDGNELLTLAISRDKLEDILREKVFQTGRRYRRVANALRSLAKYPPAFGLIGTVLGLVNVMRGVSSGWEAKQTGLEMSVALVATLYGLLVANLFINPAGEMVLKKAQEEEELAELAIQSVFLNYDKTSYVVGLEILNSFAPEEQQAQLKSPTAEEAA
jgi:chemotaxis protein MotA